MTRKKIKGPPVVTHSYSLFMIHGNLVPSFQEATFSGFIHFFCYIYISSEGGLAETASCLLRLAAWTDSCAVEPTHLKASTILKCLLFCKKPHMSNIRQSRICTPNSRALNLHYRIRVDEATNKRWTQKLTTHAWNQLVKLHFPTRCPTAQKDSFFATPGPLE